MPSKDNIRDAKGRLGHIADIYWGVNSMSRRFTGAFIPTPDEIVERVLADYAIGGGSVPIDVLKKRAQERVKGLDAPKS